MIDPAGPVHMLIAMMSVMIAFQCASEDDAA